MYIYIYIYIFHKALVEGFDPRHSQVSSTSTPKTRHSTLSACLWSRLTMSDLRFGLLEPWDWERGLCRVSGRCFSQPQPEPDSWQTWHPQFPIGSPQPQPATCKTHGPTTKTQETFKVKGRLTLSNHRRLASKRLTSTHLLQLWAMLHDSV